MTRMRRSLLAPLWISRRRARARAAGRLRSWCPSPAGIPAPARHALASPRRLAARKDRSGGASSDVADPIGLPQRGHGVAGGNELLGDETFETGLDDGLHDGPVVELLGLV